MIAYPSMVYRTLDARSVRVPDLMWEHCRDGVSAGLGGVAGVEAAWVDPERKPVLVDGDELCLPTLRAAVARAAYRVEP